MGCDKLLASGSVWEKKIEEQTGRRALVQPEGRGRRILSEYTQAAATSSVDKSVFSDVFCNSPFLCMFNPFLSLAGLHFIRN